MKIFLVFFLAAMICCNAIAQTNTFPSSGNVGIGTTSPGYKLELTGSSSSAIARILATDATRADLRMETTGNGNNYITFGNGTVFDRGRIEYSHSGNSMHFITNSTERLKIADNGNVGIGTSSPAYKLQVTGDAEIGDSHDPTAYGSLQLVRPSNQGDNKFHLSFIRNGVSVSGMGYGPNSNLLGIWHANNNVNAPLLGFTYDQKIGVGRDPVFKFDINSPDNDGATRLRIANTASSGTNAAGSFPTIELLGARGDGNISFEGRLALGTRRTDGSGLTNQTLGAVLFGGQHGTDNTFQASKILYPASIQGIAEGSFTNATTMPTAIVFSTGSTGDDVGAANYSYGTERMRITNSGNVGIGTSDPKGYRLAVNGDAIFTKVKVKAYANWPDYVFEKDYPLPTLSEVEKFIQENKHLPGIPTANEVEKEGLDIGDNQSLLLKKIEELTLYLIEQNKKIEAQEKRIQQLEQQLKK